MDNRPDIFLSHHSSDGDWVELLARHIELDQDGPPLRVFLDKWDIHPGADIPAILEVALQTSRYIGLVLSPAALSSDWVGLEYSSAIFADPRAKDRRLIPLLRQTCTIPDMLARIKYIDFRDDREYPDRYIDLINLLRGRPISRAGITDIYDVHYREDAALLVQHRRIFNRPAFMTPCLHELSIRELRNAIDDVIAALNTGVLISRGVPLPSFPDRSTYRLQEFRDAFGRISDNLIELKRKVVECSKFVQRHQPSNAPSVFNTLVRSLTIRSKIFFGAFGTGGKIRTIFDFMDEIDRLRNEILKDLNLLLEKCGEPTFAAITVSSELAKGNMPNRLAFS